MIRSIVGALLFAANLASADTVDEQLQRMAHNDTSPLNGGELRKFESLISQSDVLNREHVDRNTTDAIGSLLLLSDADDAFQQKQTDDTSDLWSRVGIDVDAAGFAFLVDSIERAHGRPPIFGAAPSIEGNRIIAPSEGVDAARDRIGLPPFTDFQNNAERQLQHGADPKVIFRRSLAMRSPVYLTDWPLRARLLKMVREDQSVREGPALDARADKVDENNHSELLKIEKANGFADVKRVGRFGVSAEWLIVQHQIKDPSLMKRFREFAAREMDRGELARVSFALLDDRIRCYIDGELELYGTQPGGQDKKGLFIPVADPQHINERRAAMHMDPIDLTLVRGDCKNMQNAFTKPAH